MTCAESVELLRSGSRSGFKLKDSQYAAVNQDSLLLDVRPPVYQSNASARWKEGSRVRQYIHRICRRLVKATIRKREKISACRRPCLRQPVSFPPHLIRTTC
jgi:hypothetical protein